MFGNPQPKKPEDQWRRQLDQFIKTNRQELAALAWGLHLERPESKDTLGIDLQPTPHFVYCPQNAIEELNRKSQNQLQEILGIVDAHQPEKDVFIIGIGNDQLKLIQFEPEPTPPECFQQIGQDVDGLLTKLEERLKDQIPTDFNH
jgi:hypothetical protein